MNTNQYLDKAKTELGLESDYALAKSLGMRPSAISNYRSGRSQMDDETCIKIASAVKIHPGIVMLDMHRERAKTPQEKAVWSTVMEKFSMSFNALISRPNPRRRMLSAW